MNRLTWRPMALADRDAIMVYIAQDSPTAAIDLDLEFEANAEYARLRPSSTRLAGSRAHARSSCG